MATYHSGFRTAAQLTAETRAAADVISSGDALTAFLPDSENDTLDYEIQAGDNGLPSAASFRSFDATAPWGREEAVGSKSGKLPASSTKLPLGELQQLQLRQAGADQIGAALDKKARNNGASIAARAKIARGEAISTGKVTLNENELAVEVDFGRKPGHTVTAAKLWTATDATPISDILGWQTTYRASNGGDAQGALFSTAILNALSTNAEVLSFAYGSTANTPTRATRDAVLGVLASFGIIDPVVYDEQVKVGGSAQRVIAENAFVLTPSRAASANTFDSGPLGTTDWGIPAEAFQKAYGIPSSEQAGIFGGAFSHTDPEGMYVLASSIFLPVVQVPDATFTATVLA